MKIAACLTLILLNTLPLHGQKDPLPKQWDKTFVITVSHTGSMSGSTSRLTFTYDSCTLISSSRHDRPVKKRFALSQTDRDVILKKMNDLKVDKIKAGMMLAVQNDGWSDLLCFGGHCIEGGSGAEMTDGDKNIFLDTSRYLEEFANKK